jgi:uncharacterized membrane protein
MTPTLALHDWQNFYMLTGAAAATLIGLLFVAVSISVGTNITVGQARDSLRTFVSPILGLSVTDLLCLAIGLRNTWMLTIWLVLHQGQGSRAASEGQTTSADSESLIG